MYYEDANGQIRHSDNSQAIMIQSAESLAALSAKFGSGIVVPGLIAFTPGYKGMWQLKGDGTWENIVGGESNGN